MGDKKKKTQHEAKSSQSKDKSYMTERKYSVDLPFFLFWQDKSHRRFAKMASQPKGPIEYALLAKQLHDFDLVANPGLPQWNGKNVELMVSTTDRKNLTLEYWQFSAELYAEAGRLYALINQKNLSQQEYGNAELIKSRIAFEKREQQKLLNMTKLDVKASEQELVRFKLNILGYEKVGPIEITCKRLNSAADYLAFAHSMFEQEKFKDADISMKCNEVDEYTYRLICLHIAHEFASKAAKTLHEAELYAKTIRRYIKVKLTELDKPSPNHIVMERHARAGITEKICSDLAIKDKKDIPSKIKQEVDYLVRTKIAESRFIERLAALRQFIHAVEKVSTMFKRIDIIQDIQTEIVHLNKHLQSNHVEHVEKQFLDLISQEKTHRTKERPTVSVKFHTSAKVAFFLPKTFIPPTQTASSVVEDGVARPIVSPRTGL